MTWPSWLLDPVDQACAQEAHDGRLNPTRANFLYGFGKP